jgi:F-type H+-transporting ATPase subunit a
VGIASSLMATGIMLLEVFVAFLQAYVFALLTAVFIGLMQEAH